MRINFKPSSSMIFGKVCSTFSNGAWSKAKLSSAAAACRCKSKLVSFALNISLLKYSICCSIWTNSSLVELFGKFVRRFSRKIFNFVNCSTISWCRLFKSECWKKMFELFFSIRTQRERSNDSSTKSNLSTSMDASPLSKNNRENLEANANIHLSAAFFRFLNLR